MELEPQGARTVLEEEMGGPSKESKTLGVKIDERNVATPPFLL